MGVTYYIKPLTVAETRRLFQSAKKDEITMLVDAIIMKAEKENGDKAFSVADKEKLLNQADVDIVKTLGSFIINEFNTDDVKKKLRLENDFYAIFFLAEKLNKNISEIYQMSKAEFDSWFMYLEVKAEKEKFQLDRAKARSKK